MRGADAFGARARTEGNKLQAETPMKRAGFARAGFARARFARSAVARTARKRKLFARLD